MLANHCNLYLTLPFTIVIIMVPSSMLLCFLYLFRECVVDGVIKASVFVYLEKVSIFLLLVIEFVIQSMSSWMSFEIFFSLMFEDTIRDAVLSVKKKSE
ncbi:hypothetical protein [Borrelia persica]|uniref:hypothetical protein n=1 Tax=Borrelia persica TaxID=44448 RepID=UPI000467A121|nr:hypothetical protein [Borrelia persica]